MKKVSETFGVSIAELVGEKNRFVVAEDEESFIMNLLKTMTPEKKRQFYEAFTGLRESP